MTDLSKAERRWIDRPDDDGRRRHGSDQLVRRAAERHQTCAGQVAAALISATCTVPPQQRGGRTAPGAGRSSDVTNRTLGQIEATIGTVDRALTRFGHLLDRCPACPDGERQPVPAGCNSIAVTTLADLNGGSWMWVVDHCVGVSPTSPLAVEAAAVEAARQHAAGAVMMLRRWRDAWAEGAEQQVLDGWAHQANRLSLQMAGLADSLAQWRPGPLVRLCACGCRRPAPPVGEGATRSGCRTRRQRERNAG